MDKQKFFLFRRKRLNHEGYEYIQHMISPSHNGGLSCSCWPEFAWRGQSTLDIMKMKYLISISKYYKDGDWRLVRYEMERDTPSWATQPKKVKYENLFITGRDKLTPLSETERNELEQWKIKAFEQYADK